MKRLTALLLSAILLLTGCAGNDSSSAILESFSQSTTTTTTTATTTTQTTTTAQSTQDTTTVPEFAGMNDPALLQYTEDAVYAELTQCLESDNYIVENIVSSYISQEYLDELQFNSQSNIYFGYTTAEVNEAYQGSKYVFSVDNEGQTIVKEFETIEEEITKQIIRNVAIGAGVILVCVTVSYVTKSKIPTMINAIFTVSALNAQQLALSSGILGGISSGIVKAYQTGNVKEALKSAAVGASEGFKWGAIIGAIEGGTSKLLSIFRSSRIIRTPRQSEIDVFNQTANAVQQVAFLNGKVVNINTEGSTRPDVAVKNLDGTYKAIEVKNYDLKVGLSSMISKLKAQISDRIQHLPIGSTQEIVLDVRGRNYSTQFIKSVIAKIRDVLDAIYPNIPIRVLRY